MKNHSIKLGILLFTSILTLTACGQKGALYLPEKTTSDLPTQTADNPTDFTNVENPTTIDPTIKPNADY